MTFFPKNSSKYHSLSSDPRPQQLRIVVGVSKAGVARVDELSWDDLDWLAAIRWVVV